MSESSDHDGPQQPKGPALKLVGGSEPVPPDVAVPRVAAAPPMGKAPNAASVARGVVTPAGAPTGPVAWAPTDRLRGAQWAKVAFGAAVTGLFAASMVHEWNMRTLRFLFALFACVVAYLTYRAIIDDLRRRHQRQVRLLHGALYVSSCEGVSVIPLDKVSFAQWRSDMDAASGLWFFDHDKKVLAHLNTGFLADADQAKLLLSWAAAQHAFSFEVRWS